MRTIRSHKIGKELLDLINEEDPIDDDIGIEDENGRILGVLIPEKAYQFFLDKVEEEEDRIDIETINEFRASGEKHEQ